MTKSTPDPPGARPGKGWAVTWEKFAPHLSRKSLWSFLHAHWAMTPPGASRCAARLTKSSDLQSGGMTPFTMQSTTIALSAAHKQVDRQ